MRHAIVRNGEIENLVEIGEGAKWAPPEGAKAFPFATGPGAIGWPWNNGSPVDPDPPKPPPEPDYKEKRRAEYPPVGDQLDAILKGGADLDALKATVAAIKLKYPKPEGGGK